MKSNYLTQSNVSHSINQVRILLVVFLLVISLCGCKPATEKAATKAPEKPIAIKTYIQPTDQYPKGHNRIEYQYGVLRISQSWNSFSRVTNKHMFVNLDTAWPDFGDKYYSSISAQVDKVRFLFEVGTINAPFKNLYRVMMNNKEKGLIDESSQDNRFSNLIGYKLKSKKHFSLYQVTAPDITNVMVTPIVISCTEDNVTGQDMLSKQGHCSYNLIMDPALRIQIRFNKPHLKNFIALHEKAMQLINTIRTVK